MTNLEKIIEVDRERFLKEIAEKLCFNIYHHKVMVVQPPLCGDCPFGEVNVFSGSTKFKCHTEEIIEWLNEEAEE